MSESASSNGNAAEEREEPLRLGGMALKNGLLIHGPTSWAVAARAPDGGIEVASGSKPSLARGRLAKIPLVRGALRLTEAFAVIPIARLGLPTARLPFEDVSVLGTMAVSATASSAIRRLGPPTARRELAISAIGSLPALAALRHHDLAAYHAVEHKAIAGYERGLDPADVPKEHQRCGSNLIVPMLVLSVVGQALVERLASEPGPLARAAVALAGAGAAVELFVYAERNPEAAVSRAVHTTGHEIQRRVSTREPTPEQLEVGIAALDELLTAERQAADTV
jgi:uncharacterized protein YqhQ